MTDILFNYLFIFSTIEISALDFPVVLESTRLKVGGGGGDLEPRAGTANRSCDWPTFQFKDAVAIKRVLK